MAHHTAEDGCRLAYEVTGPADAPPLVLSNSLGTDRSLWDAQMPAFAERFRVLRYDARGHGASGVPEGDYDIERLGRDVLSLMDAVGFARAHMCGVSIGGLTTLWLGVHAPERVNRLVLANTAARIGTLATWTERMSIARDQGLNALADATMGRWFTERFQAAAPATIARFRATMVGLPRVGYLGCCAALRDADLRREASSTQAPALVITGTHDVATPAADGTWLQEQIPGAELEEFDAAHLSNVEQASAFTERVLTFLDAPAPSPR